MKKHDFDETIELDEKGWPTKEWLERAYLEKGLSTLAIAKITGRGAGRISMLLNRYNIPVRQPIQVNKEWLEQKYVVERLPVKEIADQAEVKTSRINYLIRVYELPLKRPVAKKETPTREWLVQKYVVEGLSSKEICELTGYRNISKLLKKYNIQPKGWSKPQLEISKEELYQLHVVEGLTAVRIAQIFGCHNSAISRLIKQYDLDPGRQLVNTKKQPPLSRDELWKMYWVDELSAGQIAEQYGVARSTVLRWFKDLDVPTRKWNGGEFHRTYSRSTGDRREYEFNAIQRQQILNRDKWHCCMPGCHCNEAWKLEVHHILPIIHGGTDALENGITLCEKCHDSIMRRELDFIPIFQEIVNLHTNS